MAINSGYTLRDLPRARLEEIALRAAIEARRLRDDTRPNTWFVAVCMGFALGVALATAGFLVGAAIR
ncbi:MAG: hypothetical protein HY245_05070 [Rhizobiales bacterium]|nr:hypothetical protein [Hyphomicrobiales bacterium]MBI3672785.1 hypothetical protein [Hyphomicrobiales bacterium]